ncbi:MAG: hypothetical protein KBB86_01215 [Candidatus Pacebacteria bacterium]|nr:hypothetical protein [Candidatus Paceibacterota bacterium]
MEILEKEVSVWIINNLPALIISIVSLIISIRSWYKTRVFYDLEVFELSPYDPFGISNKEVRKKLNTGKYTILNTYTDKVFSVPDSGIIVNGGLEKKEKVFVLLGRIKK